MTVPSDYDFIGNTITESQFKNALTVLLNHIRQMSLDLVEAQGGNYSYANMALFEADKINVPANSTVRIAQGDDAGLYTWDGTNLTPAKESNFFESSNSENLFEWEDNAGNVVLALNKKGQLVSYDEDTKRSILLTNQEDIKELQKFVDELNLNNISVLLKLLATSDSSDIQRWEDLNGLPLLRLTKNGKLKSPQIDDIEYQLAKLEEIPDLLNKSESSKLIKFTDSMGVELGYVDRFNRWILGGVDVIGEISDLRNNGVGVPDNVALKQAAFQKPQSLVQIYITANTPLPADKSYKAKGKAEIHIDGQVFTAYVTLEVQGSSSVYYPKKNYTLGFFSDVGLTQSLKVQVGDVPAHDEWIFKANYVDSSNCRNVGGNNLWEDMVQSRISSNGYKREVDQYYVGKTGNDALITNAVGHVVGYPCVMYVNDEFYGVGSFNIGKKYFNYNLDRAKPTQIQIDWGGSQCDLTKMYDNYTSGAVDYKGDPVFEFKSPKKVTNATLACLSAWDAFAASSQSSFTQNANTFLNKQNAIDYYLFSDFTLNYDGLGKNFQFVSWNGVQFNFMPYDLDSIFGSNFSGTGTMPANGTLDIGDLPQNSRDFWIKLKTAYLSDMKLRYKQLRDAKIFHEDNVYKICMDLASKYPRDLILTEFDKWPDLPSKTYSNVNQIVSWSKQRLAYLDTQYEYIA
ncbi:CotH kinase family protein [Acinetobacter baumannii]|uniref:CotH kinase family protein n=1 Tax=Acinetobacter baumannii TaxID=470 RepID=UPI0024B64A54|nr:CotH kinase family protein [Acinetobacter baumannii]MDI9723350.1 CotH kinase family protein [Acinetobacter baumannii]